MPTNTTYIALRFQLLCVKVMVHCARHNHMIHKTGKGKILPLNKHVHVATYDMQGYKFIL